MPLFKTLKSELPTLPNPTPVYFRGEVDVFVGDVADETGVEEAPTAESGRPRTTVSELLQKGALIRLIATTGTVGASNNKEVKLLVRRDKLNTALTNLLLTSIKGRDIISVRVPTKATFY